MNQRSARMRLAALAVLALGGATLSASPAHAANITTNPGFEDGLAGWSCSASSGAAAVSSPVHGGSKALQATPADSDTARCQQTVTVEPSSSYTLSGWVRGGYVFLGVSGTGTTDTSTWASSPSAYTQLTRTFTTGASTRSVTIHVNGWYGQGAYQADDIVLDGPPGQSLPAVPAILSATGTDTAATVKWTAAERATGYNVYRDGAKVASTTSTTHMENLPPGAYGYQVTALNAAGETARSAQVSVVVGDDSPPPPPDPPPADRLLVGYLHASFANGSGYVRMADVPDEWDIINLSFGEPTSVTSGDIRFTRCPAAECPNVESEAEFTAAIRARQAAGKKVLISIGGQNGQVQLTTAAARDAFVRSVSAIIDRYGLDGLDIDFEGHSLYLDAGDTSLRAPTTPVIVNLIAALKALKAKYGAKFVLTMAPETFFVQLGHQFYGPGANGSADRRAGSYLPVVHAMRDDLTLLHVQDYNSGPIMGLDGQYHTMGTHDFHVAMTDMLLAGFPIAGNPANVFPALRQDQVAIGLPAAPWAGNGFTTVAEVHKALDCLTKGANCGPYRPKATYPHLRGLMTWSINWDRYNGHEFSRSHRAYLDRLG
ncbi:chitinase [Planomonospora parontospora]|uniref:chitinase n=1 Tax=Planomonospora parontospora TaxID=58119 RepID=UPI00166F7004|nr:glycoside hydrolase family 18 protein [Planomonospora parontospora]